MPFDQTPSILSRRSMLRWTGLGAAAGLLARPRFAFADAPTDNRLVVVILRGAMDGLAAIPPYGDPLYRQRRADIALPDPGETDGILHLDGFFGLNPALAPLQPLWARNELLVVPATAGGYQTRSHFDAQDLLEMGLVERRGEPGGWLNRALAIIQRDLPQRRLGLAVGPSVPLMLRGAVSIDAWEPPTLKTAAPELLAMLAPLYARDPLLGPALSNGIKAQTLSDAVLGPNLGRPQPQAPDQTADRQPKTARPSNQAYLTMAQAAGGLLSSKTGPRIAVLDMGGWDTHVFQGSTKGRLFNNLILLADSLDRLRIALGSSWSRTAVVLVTEFGRTVAPNGAKGTDHGTASMTLLLGGAVRGGRIAGDWPGLDNLVENRDLRMATDNRGVMKGILRDHLGLRRHDLDTIVFPGSAGVAAVNGLIRA